MASVNRLPPQEPRPGMAMIRRLLPLLLAAAAGAGAMLCWPRRGPAPDPWGPPPPGGWRGQRIVRHADGSLWYTGRFDGDGRPVGRHHVYFPGRLASLPADPQNPPPEAVSETLDFTRAGEPALDAAWRPQTPPWRPAGLTGDWRVHGPDGRPVSAGTYEEGRGHGTLASWDAEGMLAETSFERGVAEGPARGFYPDDRLAWTGQHRRGLREGAWTVYSPDGEKLSIDHYGAGRQNGLATTFGPGGRVEAEEPYVDGGRDGLASYYFADGRPRAQIMWRAGKPDGPWVEYFPEGGIKSRRDMREGEVDGWYETYGPDGLPAERRFFRRGEEAPAPRPEGRGE